ncbi:hypothetical protein QFC24_000319 [Naganishia onofrii]|uniref:Uncharacterized protein n=1 Tax=Naganishia onofrii TaxID=1851511 RepID=A0ACC2XWK6_9TREE|nr:hypothetical protein QFC24_000319 [Naganishia onofrii]
MSTVYKRGPIHLSHSSEQQKELDVESLPTPNTTKDHPVRSRLTSPLHLSGLAISLLILGYFSHTPYFPHPGPTPKPPISDIVKRGLLQCEAIKLMPPDTTDFRVNRTVSDRFEPKSATPVMLKNATVWTGRNAGEEILYGASVYLRGGVVVSVGTETDVRSLLHGAVEEIDLEGRWVTPGIVDMHSHAGVDASPSLKGSDDTNSVAADVNPYLMSINGFNTHDAASEWIISGGVTTNLILPGSATSMGGQAFVVKLRKTEIDSPAALMVEPPFVYDGTANQSFVRTGYKRFVKTAFGENPSRVFSQTRLDSIWHLRQKFQEASNLKQAQDDWCAKGEENTEQFPDDIAQELLVDILRGKVNVNSHSYETVDYNNLAQLTNQFKFHISTIHHAHEGYLTIPRLRQFFGGPPAAAIFATNARYKLESFRGSEYAPYILTEAGILTTCVSDHPVLNSQHLLFEAQQTYMYGLNVSAALQTVIGNPAKALGLDHRLGKVDSGFDADIVVWDSMPLQLGARPVQVYIDGIAQLKQPRTIMKPHLQDVPPAGSANGWKTALETRGDPPLRSEIEAKNVIFTGVASTYLRTDGQIRELHVQGDSLKEKRVVVRDGQITCVGDCAVEQEKDFDFIDLKGGVITAGLLTYGSYLGLMEIRQEPSTTDGKIPDPLTESNAYLSMIVPKGADGALFDQKDQLIAYKNGVTRGVVHPIESGVFEGISYAYDPSARHALDGGILQREAALHIKLSEGNKLSSAAVIGVIRKLLLGETEKSDLQRYFKKIALGKVPLVVAVDRADLMASLINLKKEAAPGMKLVFDGAAEAWLLASELKKADIGVIVNPARAFPGTWDSRRSLPGLPLSNMSLPAYLANHGIKVGLGINEEWMARNTRLDMAWEYTNGAGVFSKASALELVTSNMDHLLGLSESSAEDASWVAYEGNPFALQATVRAVRGENRPYVHIF